MNGIEKVVQRIQSIESRFQPKNIPGTSQPFVDILQKAQQSSLRPEEDSQVTNFVKQSAIQHGVDPQLALAVAEAESSFDTRAISPAGAVGVMQLMPDTARDLGVKNIYDPKENIDGGIRYLKQMLSIFDGDVNKALAAYNAGPEAVKKYGGVPPYQETQNYVAKILTTTKA